MQKLKFPASNPAEEREMNSVNRIAELRNKSNLSQSVLARHLDIAQNTLSQYETGVRTPPNHTIYALSALFEVTPDYLMGLEDGKEAQKLAWDDVSNKCLQRASDFLDSVSKDGEVTVKTIRDLVEIALLIERRDRA